MESALEMCIVVENCALFPFKGVKGNGGFISEVHPHTVATIAVFVTSPKPFCAPQVKLFFWGVVKVFKPFLTNTKRTLEPVFLVYSLHTTSVKT